MSELIDVNVLSSVNGFVSKIQAEESASVDVWHSAFLLSNTFPVTLRHRAGKLPNVEA